MSWQTIDSAPKDGSIWVFNGVAHRFDNDGWSKTSEGKAFQHGWDMADRHEQTNRSEK